MWVKPVLRGIMETILTTLSKVSFLEADCRAALEKAFIPFVYARDEHLLRPGEVQDRIFFVQEGVVMSHWQHDIHHHINWFAAPGDFAASVESFHYQRPSIELLTACTDVQGGYFTSKDYEKLLTKFPSLNVIVRRVLIQSLVQGQRRVYDMLALDTFERYCTFMAEQPELLRLLPNKLVAEYLGMTESTFSKMRKRFRDGGSC